MPLSLGSLPTGRPLANLAILDLADPLGGILGVVGDIQRDVDIFEQTVISLEHSEKELIDCFARCELTARSLPHSGLDLQSPSHPENASQCKDADDVDIYEEGSRRSDTILAKISSCCWPLVLAELDAHTVMKDQLKDVGVEVQNLTNMIVGTWKDDVEIANHHVERVTLAAHGVRKARASTLKCMADAEGQIGAREEMRRLDALSSSQLGPTTSTDSSLKVTEDVEIAVRVYLQEATELKAKLVAYRAELMDLEKWYLQSLRKLQQFSQEINRHLHQLIHELSRLVAMRLKASSQSFTDLAEMLVDSEVDNGYKVDGPEKNDDVNDMKGHLQDSSETCLSRQRHRQERLLAQELNQANRRKEGLMKVLEVLKLLSSGLHGRVKAMESVVNGPMREMSNIAFRQLEGFRNALGSLDRACAETVDCLEACITKQTDDLSHAASRRDLFAKQYAQSREAKRKTQVALRGPKSAPLDKETARVMECLASSVADQDVAATSRLARLSTHVRKTEERRMEDVLKLFRELCMRAKTAFKLGVAETELVERDENKLGKEFTHFQIGPQPLVAQDFPVSGDHDCAAPSSIGTPFQQPSIDISDRRESIAGSDDVLIAEEYTNRASALRGLRQKVHRSSQKTEAESGSPESASASTSDDSLLGETPRRGRIDQPDGSGQNEGVQSEAFSLLKLKVAGNLPVAFQEVPESVALRLEMAAQGLFIPESDEVESHEASFLSRIEPEGSLMVNSQTWIGQAMNRPSLSPKARSQPNLGLCEKYHRGASHVQTGSSVDVVCKDHEMSPRASSAQRFDQIGKNEGVIDCSKVTHSQSAMRSAVITADYGSSHVTLQPPESSSSSYESSPDKTKGVEIVESKPVHMGKPKMDVVSASGRSSNSKRTRSIPGSLSFVKVTLHESPADDRINTLTSNTRENLDHETSSLHSLRRPDPHSQESTELSKSVGKRQPESVVKGQLSTKRSLDISDELRERFQIDEVVLANYSCALSLRILLHGKLYVTRRVVAFFSVFNDITIFGIEPTTVVMAFDDICDIKKKNNALIFPNAIEFTMKNGTVYFLASFLARDKAFDFVHQLWTICRESASPQPPLMCPSTPTPASTHSSPLPFAVVPSSLADFSTPSREGLDIPASEQGRWETFLCSNLQPPLPKGRLKQSQACAKWRCDIGTVFLTLFGNAEDARSAFFHRYLEATGGSQILITDWDGPLPYGWLQGITGYRRRSSAAGVGTYDPGQDSQVTPTHPLTHTKFLPSTNEDDILTTISRSPPSSVSPSHRSKSCKPGLPVGRLAMGQSFLKSPPSTTKVRKAKKGETPKSTSTRRGSAVRLESRGVDDRGKTSGSMNDDFVTTSDNEHPSVHNGEAPSRLTRRITYLRSVKKGGLASIIRLPDYAPVEEASCLYVYSPTSLMVETRSCVTKVPFADYFVTVLRFRLVALNNMETQLDVEMGLEWLHSTFLHSKIEAEAISGVREALEVFVRLATESLNPDGPALVRTPSIVAQSPSGLSIETMKLPLDASPTRRFAALHEIFSGIVRFFSEVFGIVRHVTVSLGRLCIDWAGMFSKYAQHLIEDTSARWCLDCCLILFLGFCLFQGSIILEELRQLRVEVGSLKSVAGLQPCDHHRELSH